MADPKEFIATLARLLENEPVRHSLQLNFGIGGSFVVDCRERPVQVSVAVAGRWVVVLAMVECVWVDDRVDDSSRWVGGWVVVGGREGGP
jgi:hypothetical protein